MFKKISHIFLTLVLLTATIGMAVSRHYCAGELVRISVYGSDEGCCDDGNCCRNEAQFYQVKDSFAQPASAFIPVNSIISLLADAFIPVIGSLTGETENSFAAISESPPVLSLKKAISLRQVFLL